MYAILGKKKEALKWLNKAVNKGWLEYRTNLVYPFLDSVKSSNKFSLLVSKMKTKIDSLKFLLMDINHSAGECN